MERFAEKIVQKCIKSKTSLLFQARRIPEVWWAIFIHRMICFL